MLVVQPRTYAQDSLLSVLHGRTCQLASVTTATIDKLHHSRASSQ